MAVKEKENEEPESNSKEMVQDGEKCDECGLLVKSKVDLKRHKKTHESLDCQVLMLTYSRSTSQKLLFFFNSWVILIRMNLSHHEKAIHI